MTDLQILINTPLGAVYFVSSTIALFVLLAIVILKKGNDVHSILGYLFFFSLCFANYAAAVSYYEGYLPFAAISVVLPVSTISLFVGLVSIVPKSKSLFRIRIHIVSTCVSITSVFLGILINWYHFKVISLDIISRNDFTYLITLTAPILVMGAILSFYFFIQSNSYFEVFSTESKDVELIYQDATAKSKVGVRTQTPLIIGEQTSKSDSHTVSKPQES